MATVLLPFPCCAFAISKSVSSRTRERSLGLIADSGGVQLDISVDDGNKILPFIQEGVVSNECMRY